MHPEVIDQGLPDAPSGSRPPASRPTIPRRRSVWTLIITAAFILLAAGVGVTTQSELVGGGMVDTSAEASQAMYLLEDEFPVSRPNVIIVVRPATGSADDLVQLGPELTERVARLPEMIYATSYWVSQDPRLRSQDGRSALILGVSALEPDRLREEVDKIANDASARGARMSLGGFVEVNRAIEDRTARDLLRTELVAIPLLLVVLMIAFRGVVPALLPMGLGLLSITGALLVLRLITIFTPVSVFSLNVCTALGLGLAVDYSLLIISRFREELQAGRCVDEAVVITRSTAGRTVLFSAAIVALSLAALLVFPQYFIRSFGYAGIAVVALTAAGSVFAVPAALHLLGRRVLPAGQRRANARRAAAKLPEATRWYRFAAAVLRRRWIALLGGTLVLLALAVPALQLQRGLPDDRQLPATTEASQVQGAIRTEYRGWSNPVDVAVRGLPADIDVATGEMRDYAERISALPNVEWVDGAFGTASRSGGVPANELSVQQFAKPSLQWLSVGSSLDPNSRAAQQLVEQIRAIEPPGDALIGGAAADVADTSTSIRASIGWAVLIVVVVAFVVLFTLTGGLLLPLKAVVLNVLSLAATFGVLVWGFQHGHLRPVLGNFQTTGYLDFLVLVLVGGIAFALAMDYEVFLLSRVKEEYELTDDVEESIKLGLSHTGGIITVAAALICVVFVGLASSAVVDLKVVGIGLLIGILLDATLVRCIMVPAFLALTGRANWWAPAPLRALHGKIGVRH